MKTISLDKIRTDGGTQPREHIDTDYVAELAESADKLPPLTVFHDGAEYWLADGFHRYFARKQAGKQTAPVDIKQGTQRDAILFSVGANCVHGLRRTNADKRKAVATLLADKDWAKKSDRWIAEACGVSDPFVGQLRKSTCEPLAPEREGKDGKKYTVRQESAQDVPDSEGIPMGDEEGGTNVSNPLSSTPNDADPEILAILARVSELEEFARGISKIKSFVVKKVEEGDELFARINLTQFQAYCNNIYRAVKSAMPTAVCIYCQGRGRKSKDCKACGSRGWMDDGQYQAAPEEMK